MIFFGFRDTLKPLKKELKLAGADMSAVKNWQKLYEQVKKKAPQMQHTYDDVKNALQELSDILKHMEIDLADREESNYFAWRNPMQVLNEKLKTYGEQLEFHKNNFNHDFLISEEDTEFHLSYATLLKFCLEGIEEHEMLFMQSEVENLMAITKEALQKECPDFKALAFFDMRRSANELLELPHFEKITQISDFYENEFLTPMQEILLEAFKNAKEDMSILLEKKDLSEKERIDYILKEKIWDL